MRKPLKVIIMALGFLLLILTSWASLKVLAHFGFKIRDYQERYRECPPSEVLSEFEKVFHVSFPSDISEVKAAKTPVLDGSILFMVRFSAQPESIQKFLESFPAEPEPFKIELEPYDIARDTRNSHARPSPSWSKEPIQGGKMARYSQASGKLTIYVDDTGKESCAVYLDGFYSQIALKSQR